MQLRRTLFTLPLYLISVVLFFNSSSSLVFWIILEINVLCFSIMAIRWGERISTLLYYILIQTSGSLIYLIHVFLDESWSSCLILTFALFIKMGAFPFQFWVLSMANSVEWKTFLVLLTLQKIPRVAILFTQESLLIFWVCLFNIFIGSFMLIFTRFLKELFVSSSIYINFWNYIILSLFPIGFVFFFFLYRIRIYWRIGSLIEFKSISAALVSSFLIGLPPFSIFFLKFFFIDLMSAVIRWLLFIFVWLASLLCVAGYVKYFVSKLCSFARLVGGVVKDVKPLFLLSMRFIFTIGGFQSKLY